MARCEYKLSSQQCIQAPRDCVCASILLLMVSAVMGIVLAYDEAPNMRRVF